MYANLKILIQLSITRILVNQVIMHERGPHETIAASYPDLCGAFEALVAILIQPPYSYPAASVTDTMQG